jgi:hypothetical protein
MWEYTTNRDSRKTKLENKEIKGIKHKQLSCISEDGGIEL